MSTIIACMGCAAATPAKVPAPNAPVGDISRFAPFENDTVLAYETYVEDTNEHGIMVFEIKRPRPELAELSVAGRVRKRYYFEPGGVRGAQGGYLLKSPLEANAEWQGEDGQVKVTAVNQTVTVPAGTFSGCIQTVEQAKLAAATRTTTTAFCPGVGITTLQIEGEQEGTSMLQRISLKSFGPRFAGK
ncbi:MAG TPA: hypothetical protein VHV51_19510 [Polyangiaceae bacterium]|nr:hypothetical protein [Polyangiaceae bacterium]